MSVLTILHNYVNGFGNLLFWEISIWKIHVFSNGYTLPGDYDVLPRVHNIEEEKSN